MRGVVALVVAFAVLRADAARVGPRAGSGWRPHDEEALGKVAGLVLPYGYPLEVHSVTTDDGFILTLLRIPHGAPPDAASGRSVANTNHSRVVRTLGGGTARSGTSGRPVVLLQHGLLDSAAGFLLNGPGKSLAFLLADAGWDVWMGNVRGNSLSRAHTTLDPADAAFWRWSYDEIVSYDMPATVRHVLATSAAPALSYVGYSQGTTVMLAALAGRAGCVPSLAAALVERAVLLAPVAVAKHISSVPLLAMAALDTDDMFSLMGVHEFLPSQAMVAMLEGSLCTAQPYLCVSFLAALCGYNPNNLDTDRLATYFKFTPAGTSVQNMAHWAQAVRSRAPNTMSTFDYGTNCANGFCNQLVYGSMAPLLYNLSAITTPLYIASGTQDRLSTPVDVEYLLESLEPGVVQHAEIIQTYEHLDFIWGIDAKATIYDGLMRWLATAPAHSAAAGELVAAGRKTGPAVAK